MIFHWYPLLQLFLMVSLITWFPYIAYKSYLKTKNIFSKTNMLLCMIVVVYLFGYVYQIGNYHSQERVISSYDSQVPHDDLTIKKKSRTVYEAPDHSGEIKEIEK